MLSIKELMIVMALGLAVGFAFDVDIVAEVPVPTMEEEVSCPP